MINIYKQKKQKKKRDFDPAKFTKESAKVIGDNINPQSIKAIKDNKEAARRQSNMASVIESTVMSIQKADSMVKTAVLDMETFMTAFDDYTKNAPNTDGVGIPVGMNVLSFARNDICYLYAKQELGFDKDVDDEDQEEYEESDDDENQDEEGNETEDNK